jgi:hypothetical protein
VDQQDSPGAARASISTEHALYDDLELAVAVAVAVALSPELLS